MNAETRPFHGRREDARLLTGAGRYTADVSRSGAGLDTQAEMPAARAFPSGAQVVEVEVDPDTGMVEVVSHTAVEDCGAVMNQTFLEGQILGGMLQGLGQVLGELCVYGPDGQLLTAASWAMRCRTRIC